jgi:hypothetical protein
MTLVNAEDLDTSPPDFLVEGMIPLVGVGFIWGPSRVGKSLVTNGELALAITNGTEFFGRRVAQGSVAICLGEGLYDAGVRKQARLAREQNDRVAIAAQIAEARGGEMEGAKMWLDELPPYTDDNLFYMTEPFILPLANQGEPTQSLRATADALRQIPDLQLVILDSFSDFTPSLSIANEASANRSIQGMKWLSRELDCVVLAVAHPVGNGSKMSGSGRLFNAADFVIQVQPDSGAGRGFPGATIVCEKNKFGRMFEPFGYYIEPCSWYQDYEDDDGVPTGEQALVETATVRALDVGTRSSIPMPKKEKPKLPSLILPTANSRAKRSGVRPKPVMKPVIKQES